MRPKKNSFNLSQFGLAEMVEKKNTKSEAEKIQAKKKKEDESWTEITEVIKRHVKYANGEKGISLSIDKELSGSLSKVKLSSFDWTPGELLEAAAKVFVQKNERKIKNILSKLDNSDTKHKSKKQ